MALLPSKLQNELVKCIISRAFRTTCVVNKIKVGKYKVTKDRSRPLTYEMAMRPHYLAHRKSWNSWNTSNLLDGRREPETSIDDMFVRKFMNGTWPNLFVSDIIIKKHHNITRIAGIVVAEITPQKMYFLIGYCEELLSYWLKGPVKLEIQVVKRREDVVYKYI